MCAHFITMMLRCPLKLISFARVSLSFCNLIGSSAHFHSHTIIFTRPSFGSSFVVSSSYFLSRMSEPNDTWNELIAVLSWVGIAAVVFLLIGGMTWLVRRWYRKRTNARERQLEELAKIERQRVRKMRREWEELRVSCRNHRRNKFFPNVFCVTYKDNLFIIIIPIECLLRLKRILRCKTPANWSWVNV